MRCGLNVLSAFLCAALFVLAGAAHAQTATASARAFEAYGRGQRLFGEHDYAGAQAAFEEAYQAVSNPIVLLGVAEAQQRQSLWTDAVATLTRYLNEAPDAANRQKVEQEIAGIQAALAPVTEQASAAAPVPAAVPAPVVVQPVAATPLTVVYKSKVSSSYKLVRAVFEIDGEPILMRSEEKGNLADPQRWPAALASLAPGKHVLTIQLDYKGASFGLFSYLEGYRFTLRSSFDFNVSAGNGRQLTVIAYEQGGPTTPAGERLRARFEQQPTSQR